jgi:site-specific recombinase XerD
MEGRWPACGVEPAQVTREDLEAYFRRLAAQGCSAAWMAMNISLLRTVFDKICGRSLLEGRCGPRRPDELPRILSREQIAALMRSAGDFRETLLLGLLYGCGLKVGEACALKWDDVAADGLELQVPGSGSTRPRAVPVPDALRPLLVQGVMRFAAEAPVFPGRRAGTALSVRMAERIICRCGRGAALPSYANSMALRHAFAVHALEDGLNIRELQERLGHRSIETTMRYQRCLVPVGAVSPLDETDLDDERQPAAASHTPSGADRGSPVA